MKVRSKLASFAAGAALLAATGASGATLTVQNNSFESPPVPTGQPVALTADNWTLNGSGTLIPVPGVGNVPGGAGVFPNPANPGGTPPAPGQPYSNGHLDNADQSQVAYLFSNLGNSITTDPNSHPGNFAAGNQYSLTASVALAQSAPPATDRLLMELYWTDASSNVHVIGQRAISLATDPTLNQQSLVDYTMVTPLLAAGDPAVGQAISIGFVTPDNGGGQFDLDNVRLASNTPEPVGLSAIGAGAVALLMRRKRRQTAV